MYRDGLKKEKRLACWTFSQHSAFVNEKVIPLETGLHRNIVTTTLAFSLIKISQYVDIVFMTCTMLLQTVTLRSWAKIFCWNMFMVIENACHAVPPKWNVLLCPECCLMFGTLCTFFKYPHTLVPRSNVSCCLYRMCHEAQCPECLLFNELKEILRLQKTFFFPYFVLK